MAFGSRTLSITIAAALLAGGALQAQSPVPSAREPGRPPQFTLPATPSVTDAPGRAVVAPGPAPWYTVFGTSEVVGFIEPCG